MRSLGLWRLDSKGGNAAAELPNAAELLAHAGKYVDAWLFVDERTSSFSGGEVGEPPVEPEVPEVRWRTGEPFVCSRCMATTRRALLEVRRLAAEVAADADGLRAASRWSRVSGTRPHGSPSPVGDLLHDLTKDLLDFEARYLKVRGWPAPVSVSHGADARGRAVAFLVEHLESVLAVEELDGLVEVALGWERRIGDGPGWTPARCRCGERNQRGLVVEEAG
ncbi:hypothetical protein ACIHFD_31520 [Nonomuraea sp. NPDC051941]|uniref:hypothetical protein n=1 Tax=Nonomuraea sp. NPDC051941 TaxID=3364373 RepID=UPI0037CACE81